MYITRLFVYSYDPRPTCSVQACTAPTVASEGLILMRRPEGNASVMLAARALAPAVGWRVKRGHHEDVPHQIRDAGRCQWLNEDNVELFLMTSTPQCFETVNVGGTTTSRSPRRAIDVAESNNMNMYVNRGLVTSLPLILVISCSGHTPIGHEARRFIWSANRG